MSTIYLIGDSTVDDFKEPFRGWGWALPAYVYPHVRVRNHARSGRSSRSFWEEGLFEPVYQSMSQGDLLLIQFGHNDEKDDERHTDPHTTYTENLWRYCRMAQEKGAQPVLFTPVARRFFAGETSILYTHGEYPLAVRTLARERGIPLCDLKKDSRALFLRVGKERTAKLFVRMAPGENPEYPKGYEDFTHFNAIGAKTIAGLAASELLEIPVCNHFIRPKAEVMQELPRI
ncbi:MAG: rhamnogalacturonan acetylesterase [Clostridia bacterium]|nr:rhamnogalacturonan acetylesterase [Clostridia bacterium]